MDTVVVIVIAVVVIVIIVIVVVIVVVIQYRQLRLLFDNGYDSCSSPAHLYRLSSQLLLFYSESTDHQRLVSNNIITRLRPF